MIEAMRGKSLAALFATAVAACAIALCAFLPQSAWAADVASEGDLAKAIDEGSITLTENVNADVVIPKGKTVTLDLNGKTLTNKTSHTIENNGTLTITGEGTVLNVSGGKGALYTAPTGSTTINGGKLEGSSWYVVKNLGSITFNGGSLVQNDAGSSAIDNGYYGNPGNDCNVEYPNSATVNLIINAGTFAGGMNTVKNDDFGTLTIAGGSFSNTTGPAVMNWNTANITGGTFSVPSGHVISNGALAGNADKGQLTISGGTFTSGNDGADSLLGQNGNAAANMGTLTVEDATLNGSLAAASGVTYDFVVKSGTFSDPTVAKYIADGDATLANADGTFSVATEASVKAQAVASVTKDGATVYYTTKKAAQQAADAAGTKPTVVNYTVTINDGVNDERTELVKPDGTIADKLIVPDKPGYKGLGWFVGDKAFSATDKITADTTVVFKWEALPIVKVAASVENGTLTTEPADALANGVVAGSQIVMHFNANEGYELAEMIINGKSEMAAEHGVTSYNLTYTVGEAAGQSVVVKFAKKGTVAPETPGTQVTDPNTAASTAKTQALAQTGDPMAFVPVAAVCGIAALAAAGAFVARRKHADR